MREEKRWTSDEVQFLKNNYQTMPYVKIGEHLGRKDSAIRAKCFDLGLIKKDHWTQDELDFIAENAATMSYREMAEYLNRTTDAIQLKARRCLKIKKTPYNCNHHYFEKIDNEEKAYWLGFIYADGYVSINHDTNSCVVGIDLQNNDKKHLQKFNKSIGGNYKITDRERPCSLSKDQDKLNLISSIRVYSVPMVHDLLALGVNENKTYDLQFLELSEDLMPHFIRGYFDGNGTVTYREGTHTISPRCSIFCNQLPFLEPLRTYLYQKKHICSYITWSETCYRLTIAGVEYARQFLDYIYGNATVYLDRKYHRYQIIKNHEVA